MGKKIVVKIYDLSLWNINGIFEHLSTFSKLIYMIVL